jgi:nucleoid DNA-binding protein
MTKTETKEEPIKTVAKKVNLPQNETDEIISTIFETVMEPLAKDNKNFDKEKT